MKRLAPYGACGGKDRGDEVPLYGEALPLMLVSLPVFGGALGGAEGIPHERRKHGTNASVVATRRPPLRSRWVHEDRVYGPLVLFGVAEVLPEH